MTGGRRSAVICAPVVVMVREVSGGEGGPERPGWLRLARTEADVNTGAIDHRHEADGNERTQRERRQQYEREQRRAPPRRQPVGKTRLHVFESSR